MTILNIGSINWDRVYRVAHFPQPGETISSLSAEVGLGGKGLNQSVAILRSGGKVVHCGAVGANDASIIPAIAALGLDTRAIVSCDGVETGSALILVESGGENLIVLDPGANRALTQEAIEAQVAARQPGDWLLVQNETNAVDLAIAAGQRSGLKVALAAAPFVAEAVIPHLGHLSLLSVNEIEFGQLCAAVGGEPGLPGDLDILISLGSRGARLRSRATPMEHDSFKVEAIDTTGAGDTALGAFIARLDCGDAPQVALRFSMAAAALQVSRRGAVGAIPERAEVLAYLGSVV